MINGKNAITSATANKSRAQQIDEILFHYEDCFPKEAYGEAMLNVWHKCLAGYEITAIADAFQAHVSRRHFLPDIADILTILTKGEVTIEARAQDQWRVVMEAVRQYGLNHPPPFDDPITADLIARQFSWQYMCNIETEDIKWELKRWVEAFELAAELPAARHQRLIQAPAPLKRLAAGVGQRV